jgi:hypothetical protein
LTSSPPARAASATACSACSRAWRASCCQTRWGRPSSSVRRVRGALFPSRRADGLLFLVSCLASVCPAVWPVSLLPGRDVPGKRAPRAKPPRPPGKTGWMPHARPLDVVVGAPLDFDITRWGGRKGRAPARRPATARRSERGKGGALPPRPQTGGGFGPASAEILASAAPTILSAKAARRSRFYLPQTAAPAPRSPPPKPPRPKGC